MRALRILRAAGQDKQLFCSPRALVCKRGFIHLQFIQMCTCSYADVQMLIQPAK